MLVFSVVLQLYFTLNFKVRSKLFLFFFKSSIKRLALGAFRFGRVSSNTWYKFTNSLIKSHFPNFLELVAVASHLRIWKQKNGRCESSLIAWIVFYFWFWFKMLNSRDILTKSRFSFRCCGQTGFSGSYSVVAHNAEWFLWHLWYLSSVAMRWYKHRWSLKFSSKSRRREHWRSYPAYQLVYASL